MKKIAMVTAILSSAAVCQFALAAPVIEYSGSTPTKQSMTIQFSGACEGTFTENILGVSYHRQYSVSGDPAAVENATFSDTFIFNPMGLVSITGHNTVDSSGTGYSENTDNKGQFFLKSSGKNLDLSNVQFELFVGDFNSAVICPGGVPFNNFIGGFSSSLKSSGKGKYSVSLKSISETVVSYSAKLSDSGEVIQKDIGNCSKLKGVIATNGYSLICVPPKTIKYSISVSAKGEMTASPML